MQQDRNWSAASRGQGFLKKNGGLGGGNIPHTEIGGLKNRQKSNEDRSRSK